MCLTCYLRGLISCKPPEEEGIKKRRCKPPLEEGIKKRCCKPPEEEGIKKRRLNC